MQCEVPLAELAARYDDDSEEEAVQGVSRHQQQAAAPPAAPRAEAVAAAGGGAAPADAAAALIAAATAGQEEDEDWGEEEEEEEWDSADEELASAMEWADLRELHEARGHAAGGGALGASLAAHRPNAHGGALNRPGSGAKLLPTANNMGRLDTRFNAGQVQLRDDLLDSLGGLSNVAINTVKVAHGSKAAAAAARSKDRADRATVEQVLDPRTRMVLFKMLNRGVFSEINGCVSTGKEANVYHASAPEGAELAIKVYKTAILVFRDRDRYVVGDSRFQRYCKSNPRKMVKMWAEKEMRNLARLHATGIPCPKPLQLRMHVLVMEFLGEGGVAAPRLKDAGLPPARMRQAYTEMVIMIRQLYQKCRLVHADLSEYNILVHNNELHCIDVSQAVELDHPRAFDFLREDCQHVNDFFRRAGVATLTVRELFDFAVDPSFGAEGPELDAQLDRLMELAASRPATLTAEQEVADRVFAQAYIPKKLDDVINYERDHARLKAGTDTEGIYYQALAGMKEDMSGARSMPAQQPASSGAASGKGSKKGDTPQQQAHGREGTQAQHAQQGATEQRQQDAAQPPATPPQQAAAGVEQQPAAAQAQQGASPAPPADTLLSAAAAASEAVDAADGDGADGGGGHEQPRKKKQVRFEDDEGSSGSGSDDDGSGSGSEGEWEERPKLTRDQLREMRREHKKEVKAANAERRKQKIPKHVKKKAVSKNKKK
ncbi:hypothetical protein ABPG75_005931 [Micractinium tetrahymenae]